MRITYFALNRIQIGDEWREPGDLVPEAATWKHLPLYIKDAEIAPVLVATLPRNVQAQLAEWEATQEALATMAESQPDPPGTPEPDDGDERETGGETEDVPEPEPARST